MTTAAHTAKITYRVLGRRRCRNRVGGSVALNTKGPLYDDTEGFAIHLRYSSGFPTLQSPSTLMPKGRVPPELSSPNLHSALWNTQQSSSFSTLENNFPLSFDPWKHPSSAALLRQGENDGASFTAEETLLHKHLRRYEEVAIPLYQQQIDRNIDDSERNDLLSTINELQQVYMDLEYWQEALELEQDKCKHIFHDKNTDDHADSIHAQGKLHVRIVSDTNSEHAQYHATTALKLYERAFQYYESTANAIQQGHVGISMAGWHFLLHQDYDTAFDCLQQAETMFLEVLLERQNGGEGQQSAPLLLHTLLVKCFDNQGLIYRLRGDFGTALEKYQKALGVLDHVDEEENGGSSDSNEWQQLNQLRRAMQMHVGDMYMALEDSDQALIAYQELLESIQAQQKTDTANNDLSSMEGVLWHNIATIHVDHGDYETALDEYRNSIKAKERASANDGNANNESSYHPELAQTWNMMGGLLAGIFEEKGQALECFQKALMIARINATSNNVDPQSDPDVLSALQNIATMEQELSQQQRSDKE